MFLLSDCQLAWKLQIKEYKALNSTKSDKSDNQSKVNAVSCKSFRRHSQGKDSAYELKEVPGDGNCFFHAVNNPKLTRKTLISRLKKFKADEDVRKGFAFEIRKVLYIGCTGLHEDRAEKQAYKALVTKDFKDLTSLLSTKEEALREVILEIQDQFGELSTKGKTPKELGDWLKQEKSDLRKKFQEKYKSVLKINKKIEDYCSQEDVFTNYVNIYLEKAQGYIPFSRRLEGEEHDTTIDTISKLFEINIQVFLKCGSRVTNERDGPVIPIFHNGINHFSGLTDIDLSVVKPLQLGDIIDQMPSAQKPLLYSMDHLLQAGFLGTDYQLLVLLDKIVELATKDQSFSAMFEAKGHGNLDDIVISIKDSKGAVKSIEAFQVKHYNSPISADLFVNKKDNSKKDAIMHIGKFFDGWYVLKSKKPKELKCIVYSNSTLDPILQKCIKNNQFSENFIDKSKSVKLIGRALKDKDFYQAMFLQTKEYLKKKKLHSKVTVNDLLFKEFLRSFHFCTSQEDTPPLTQSIIKKLSLLMKEKNQHIHMDQLFTNLYFAVKEWFGHDCITRKTPEFTNALLIEFLNKSQIRSHDTIKIQSKTEITLNHIHEGFEGKIVSREERNNLYDALTKQGLVLVTGDKGIGKSSLVKNVLKEFEPTSYFFLATEELMQEALKTQVLGILKQEKWIRIIVLDAAESLLSMPIHEAQAFIDSFLETGCTVVLTLTSEAKQKLELSSECRAINIGPLSEGNVLELFPQLDLYQENSPLMKLACIPFYLDIILKLVSKMGKEEFHRIVSTEEVALETTLMKMVICGQNKNFAKVRKNLWMRLSVLLACGKETLSLKSEIASLDDGIVITCENGFRFSHDLYFEYGLAAFLMKKWKTSELQGKTLAFWEKLPGFLVFNNPLSVLVKWFVIGGKGLKNNLLEHSNTLPKHEELYKLLIAMAILLEDNELLVSLLKHKGQVLAINRGDSNIKLAIDLDSPQALKALFKLQKQPSMIQIKPGPKQEFWDIAETLFDLMEIFRKRCAKYWSINFKKQPQINNDHYLHQAISLNHEDCISVLLACNKEYLHGPNHYEETPLHFSVLYQREELSKQLIEEGAFCETQDAWGDTPLHNVAYNGNIQIAKLLLEQDCDPNFLNDLELSPLHIAITRLDYEMVTLFLQYEGDLSIPPFGSEKVKNADLLDYFDMREHKEMEDFVIKLIRYLNFGEEEETSDIVDDLMTLVEHRAQISESSFDFDYYDDDTELDYTLEFDPLKINEMTDYILSDPQNIDQVLSSEVFNNTKEELVMGWIEFANEDQYQNLKKYAKNYNDKDVKYWLLNFLAAG